MPTSFEVPAAITGRFEYRIFYRGYTAGVNSDLTGEYDPKTRSELSSELGSVSVSLPLPSQQMADALTGGTLTIVTGDTLTFQLTGLGSLSDVSEAWLAVKARKSEADSDAKILVRKSVGLEVIGGEEAETAANGSIVFDDPISGAVTFTVDESETAVLDAATQISWAFKVRRSTGKATTLRQSTGKIVDGVAQVTE